MTIRIGYARVSTVHQHTDNQLAKLKEAGCTKIFTDKAVSGSTNHQAKGFLGLMDRVKTLRSQGESVEVCVTKLDRFSRSLEDLLANVYLLDGLGASFTALDDAFTYDPKSPMSKLFLQMLGALAEFERSLITSRMNEGMEAKVAKGLKRGPKPTLNAVTVKAIRASYAADKPSPGKLAKEWEISRSTIIRVLELPGFKQPYVTLEEWEAAREKANA